MHERTHVGLDVHALTVIACAIDSTTGEIFRARLTPAHGEILAGIQALPGPSKVVYEAGPTGFPLARVPRDAGIDCLVAAPSRLQRPSGDRVKTDRNDALHLARLLKLDQITEVIVPDPGQEAARDLVRAREDTLGDLMRARHRVSKPLLRQGIHYTGGHTWTQAHMTWLCRQHFDSPAPQLTYDLALEAVTETLDRRDRRDKAITKIAYDSQYTPVVRALGCLRGISTLTAFGLAVGDRGLESLHRPHHRRLPGAGAHREFLRPAPVPGRHHQDRQHPRPQAPDRGSLAPPQSVHAPFRVDALPLGSSNPRSPDPRTGRQPSHERWLVYLEHRKRPVIANVAVARELAGWCWSLASEAQKSGDHQRS
ncbi:transposase [Arthrobacter sp. AZCC_0090]|nr:transposase [Arthrobacter sp. AZCC_0090]